MRRKSIHPLAKKKRAPALRKYKIPTRRSLPEKGAEQYVHLDLVLPHKDAKVTNLEKIIAREYPRLSKAKRLQILQHWLEMSRQNRVIPGPTGRRTP